MSFSSNVKQELCRLPISRRQEAAAELYGILLYCNAFTAELIRITTESREQQRLDLCLFPEDKVLCSAPQCRTHR